MHWKLSHSHTHIYLLVQTLPGTYPRPRTFLYRFSALQWLRQQSHMVCMKTDYTLLQYTRIHTVGLPLIWLDAQLSKALRCIIFIDRTRAFITFYFSGRHHSTRAVVQRTWWLIKGTGDEDGDETGELGGENLTGGSIVKMSPGFMCTKDISCTEL